MAKDGQGFSLDGLSSHIGKLIRESGVRKAGSCHLLRHSMAAQMLENGADTRWVQAMLSHADMSTTQIYTRVSIRALKEIHTAAHPAKLVRESDDKEDDRVAWNIYNDNTNDPKTGNKR